MSVAEEQATLLRQGIGDLYVNLARRNQSLLDRRLALLDDLGRPPVAPVTMKIVVAGGFAVGKTTFVGSISEIEPLRTEAEMTVESLGIDHAGHVAGSKKGTTVAMDFGRISIDEEMVLYLFGTPGQDRFWFHGTSSCAARSARSCSSTPAGCRTASPPSTTSSTSRCRSSSR